MKDMEGSRALCTKYWILAKFVRVARKCDILAAKDVKEVRWKKEQVEVVKIEVAHIAKNVCFVYIDGKLA